MAGNTGKKKVTVDLTTNVGIISFPHLFKGDAVEKDNGELSYECQFLIPKSDRDGVRAILRAIKTVGVAQWGEDNWKKVRNPIRDGDKEAGDLTEDGSTKGEKYPERLGHYFFNARSKKPVGVFDRQRVPIDDSDAVYGGCHVKVAVSFYPYSQQGNHGIGVSLNGVQKMSDGEPFGSSRPSVESMFDLIEDDDEDIEDVDLDDIEDDEPEEEVKTAAKKTAAKKTAAKKATAKKTAAKKAAAPEPDEDEDDLYDDLDDLDEDDDI
jgi:hypothetical protein